MKRVVIIGGGFGGLQVAKALGNRSEFSVILLDRRNYHLFQPLLYQVAMAGLSPADIAMPIRSILSKYKNINVLLANVESVSLENKKVYSDVGEFEYDYLVMACGAKHSYFGHEEWETRAPGLKTLEQATEIRRRVLMAFEKAESTSDNSIRQSLLSFVVVGGGPTGVELSGAIGEISRYTLAKDFKNIHPSQAKIYLIEAGERILNSFSKTLSAKAVKDLNKLGVEVLCNSRVTAIKEKGVTLGEEFIAAHTVLWAAGVQASSLNEELKHQLGSSHKVIVQNDLSLEQHPEVFVIGDQASVRDKKGNELPGLAPVAIQQGQFLGQLLKGEVNNKARKSFCYKDKGQMAAIGRRSAVLEYNGIKISGRLAWLAWLFVHIYYLIGFKNRLFVFMQWTWHYIAYGRGARLILHKEWRSFLNRKKTNGGRPPARMRGDREGF